MTQHQESPQNPPLNPDLTKIKSLARLYSKALASADIAPLRAWMDKGCSIEKDIIPTLTAIMKVKKDITSFKYFHNPVLKARDTRLQRETQADLKQNNDPEYYINIYRWKRAKGLPLGVSEENMLRAYEAKENPRAVESAGGMLGF